MSKSFYVFVYTTPFERSSLVPNLVCPDPPCAAVSYSTEGFRQALVIKQSDYEAAKRSATTFAETNGITAFTLLRIETDETC